jgi:Spy/CpxP family protein refolding chaperone
MRSLKLGIIALFLGIMGFASTSFAATNDDPQMQPKMHEMMQSCPQYQNLTAEQKTKVDKIMQDFKAKVMPLIDQMRTKQVDLDKQFENPAANESKINSLAKEVSNLRSQIFSAHIQARLDMAKAGFISADCWKSMHPKKMEKGMGMEPEQGMMMPEAPSKGASSTATPTTTK